MEEISKRVEVGKARVEVGKAWGRVYAQVRDQLDIQLWDQGNQLRGRVNEQLWNQLLRPVKNNLKL